MVLLEINVKCLKLPHSFVMGHMNQEAKAATPCTHLCKSCERGAPWSDISLPENPNSVNCGKGAWLVLCSEVCHPRCVWRTKSEVNSVRKHNYNCMLDDGIYTACPRRNVPDFGRVFLMLKYTDITQNTYIQSWPVTEIMAREKCGLLAVPRTAPF